MSQTGAQPFTIVVANPNFYESHQLADTLQQNGFIVLVFDTLPPPDANVSAFIFSASLISADELAAWRPSILVIIGDESAELVDYLEAGADDFFLRPVSPNFLIARLKAILRRSGGGTI